MLTLTSRNNPKIKQIRALDRRKGREASGLFLVEGIRHVGEAVASGAQVEYICYAPDLLRGEFAQDLIQEQASRGLPCYALPGELFSWLASKENPQGILAVVRQPQHELNSLNPGNFPWGVALVSPQDPGNIGAILRTIDAVAASGLLLLEGGADPYHPSAVRASMGALLWYPVVSASFTDFTHWAGAHGYTVYGSSAHAPRGHTEIQGYHPPLILLMGSEREGLSTGQVAACQELIRLPMRGRVTSLNLAVAAGILLYAISERLQG